MAIHVVIDSKKLGTFLFLSWAWAMEAHPSYILEELTCIVLVTGPVQL